MNSLARQEDNEFLAFARQLARITLRIYSLWNILHYESGLLRLALKIFISGSTSIGLRSYQNNNHFTSTLHFSATVRLWFPPALSSHQFSTEKPALLPRTNWSWKRPRLRSKRLRRGGLSMRLLVVKDTSPVTQHNKTIEERQSCPWYQGTTKIGNGNPHRKFFHQQISVSHFPLSMWECQD